MGLSTTLNSPVAQAATPADPTMSSVVADTASVQSGSGKYATLTATAKDSSGAPVANKAVSFAAVDQKGNAANVFDNGTTMSCTTTADGTCTVRTQPKGVTGVKIVTVRIDGSEISGSPYRMTAYSSAAANSTISFDSPDVRVGEPAGVTITVKNNTAPVGNATVNLHCSDTASCFLQGGDLTTVTDNGTTATCTTAADGTCHTNVTLSNAKLYTMPVWGSYFRPGSTTENFFAQMLPTVDLRDKVVTAADSELVVTPNTPQTVDPSTGNTFTATTTVRDQYGWPVGGKTVNYHVTAHDGSEIDPGATVIAGGTSTGVGTATCQTASVDTGTGPDLVKQGTCSITITSVAAGTFDVEATVADEATDGSLQPVAGSGKEMSFLKAASINGDIPVKPMWKKIPDWKAVWADDKPLSNDSVYWSNSWAVPNNSNPNVGDQVPMLGESVMRDDATWFTTNLRMSFERTLTSGQNNGIDTFTGYQQFTTQAMAPIGGTGSGNPMSMYFWSWGSDQFIDTRVVDCSKSVGAGVGDRYTTVVRVTDQDPDIWVGCMPVPNASASFSGADYSETTGGEGNQINGLIYIQTYFYDLDNQLWNSGNANATTLAFGVWDPVDGHFIESRNPQPADTLGLGGVSQERARLHAYVNNTTCPTGLEATCDHGSDTDATADFGLDAQGNIYMFTSSAIYRNDNLDPDDVNANGTASLVRIEPVTDENGSLISGTKANPWTYSVVQKPKKTDPSMRMNYATDFWGVGINNGKFLAGGNAPVYSDSYPDQWDTQGTYASASGTATRMLRIDPLSGSMDIIGPRSPQDNAWVSSRAHGTWVMAQQQRNEFLDDASPQMLTVLGGTVFNDANANGTIDDGEKGVPGVTVAVYSEDGTLRGSQITSQAGEYRQIVSGNGTYQVRIAQPQINGVNAVLSYAAAGDDSNTETIHCLDDAGNVVAQDNAAGACGGTKTVPYVDPPLGKVGDKSDPSTWPIYATVTMKGNTELGMVDFGITTSGSYGDAVAGPAAVSAGAPVHVQGATPSLWLGQSLGNYAGPATNGSDHNASDDGVFLQSYTGNVPLQGTLLASTRSYNLTSTVSGSNAANAKVTGWTTGTGNAWKTSATDTWKPSLTQTPGADGAMTYQAVGPFKIQQSGVVSGSPTVQLRTQVSPNETTLPTNASNQYQANLTSTTQSWTTPGEVEDYSVTAADAVYRVAATTTRGSGDGFVIDSQTLSAATGAVTLGAAKAASASQVKTVTATAPAGWQVTGAAIKNLDDGAPLDRAMTFTGAADHLSASIAFTPQLGDDLVVEVTYVKDPGAAAPDHSSLAVTPDPKATDHQPLTVGADAAATYTATTTVHDADDVPVPGQTVTYTITNADGTPVADQATVMTNKDGQKSSQGTLSCMTSDPDGDCAVTVTSTKAGGFTLTSTIADQTAGGVQAGVVGSPVSLDWKAGGATPRPGQCAPGAVGTNLTLKDAAGNLLVTSANEVTVGEQASAIAYVTDDYCNPVGEGTQVNFAADSASGKQTVSDTVKTTDANSQAIVLVSDSMAETVTVHATLPDDAKTQQDIPGSPADVNFVAGAVCVVEAGCDPTTTDPTKQTRVEITNPDAKALANGSDTKQIKAYAFDADGNPVTSGVDFVLTTVDSTLALPGAVADGAGSTVTITTGPDGTTTIDATSRVSGAHQARAAVNEKDLANHGSPLTMVFDPGDASATNSSLSVAATDANGQPVATKPGDKKIETVAGQTVTATVNVADANNNKLVGARVTLTVSGKAQFVNSTGDLTTTTCYTGGADTNGDGTPDSPLGACSVTLTDSTAETIDLHATVGATGAQVDVVDSPTAVTFTVGSISAGDSTVEVRPTSQTAGTNVSVLVTVLDANKNPVNNLREADFALTGTADGLPDMSFAHETSLFTPLGNGVYTFSSTSSLIGTFTIAASVKGAALDQKPTVTFVSGGVCVVNCHPVDNPKTPDVDESKNVTRFETLINGAKADGQATDKVKAFAYDGLGNPVDQAVVVITDQTAGRTPTGWITPDMGQASTGNDGTTELTFTSETALTYSLKGTIATLEPVTAALSLSFVPTEVNARNSSLKVEPTTTKVGQPVRATVTARDEHNNPVGNVHVDFASASPAVDFYSTPASCVTATSGANLGTCDVSLTSKHAGIYEISATIGADTVGGQGFTVPVTFTVDDVCFPDRMVCAPVDNPATPGVDESKNLTRVTVTKDGANADDEDRDEVTAHSYDKYGNGRINDVVTTTTTESDLTIKTPEAKTLADGTAVLGYTSPTSTDSHARVFINGTEVKTTGGSSPVTLHFAAGKGDPAQSYLTITPTTPQKVDSTFTLTALIKDTQNNPVEKAVVSFVSSDPVKAPIVGETDANGDVLSSCTTDVNGYCSVTVTSKKIGSYSIQATIPNAAGVPTELANGSPATATFTAKEVCLESQGCVGDPGEPKTRVEVLVNGMANDGVSRDIVSAFVYDEHGNPIKDALVTSTTSDPDKMTTQPAHDPNNAESIALTGENGQTTIWYTSKVAGEYIADVALAQGAPNGTPVRLQFGNGLGQASKSSFAITPMDPYATAPLTVGDTSSNTYKVTATIRDEFNQPVGAGSVVNFANTETGIVWGAVSNVPSITNTNSCVTDGSGTCAAYIHTTKAGTYTITARLNGDDIGAGQSASWKPDDVCVQSEGCQVPPDNPATPENESEAITRVEVTADNAPANGSATDVVTVFVHDKYGNPLQGKTVTSERSDTGDTAFIPGLVANNGGTNAQGMTTIPYTSTASGPHNATVRIDNRHTPSYPNGAAYATLTFSHGEADASKSDLKVSPTSQIAGQDVTVTASVNDIEGNPVDGLHAEDFALTGDPTSDFSLPGLTFRGFTELSKGVYTFSTTSDLAGEFIIKGQLGQMVFKQTPTVAFTAGGVCVANAKPIDNPNTSIDESKNLTRFEMSANDQVANGQAQDTAIAWAYDCNGNPVKNAAVVARDVTTTAGLVGKLTPTVQGADGSITTDDQGKATLAWSATTAGIYSAVATIDGQSADSSNLTQIRFNNDQADATRSLFEVTPTESQVVGSAFTLKATIRDHEGNAVPEASVSFGTQAPARFVDKNTCSTDENGVCQVTVTSDTVGTFEVSGATSVDGTMTPLGGDGDATKSSPQKVSFTNDVVCIGGAEVCDDDPNRRTHAEVTKDNSPADGQSTDEVTVFAYDRLGNPVPGASVKTMDGVAMTILNPSVSTNDDGQAVVRFTSTVADHHPATITINGAGGFLGEDPILTFTNSSADWTKSTLAITPNTGDTKVGASQPVTSVFTVTATVNDTNINAVPGVTVNFELPQFVTSAQTDAVSGLTTCVTNASGQCPIQISSTTAATQTIKAGLAPTQMFANSVQATWTAGSVDASTSWVEVTRDGALNDGVQRDAVTVHARDLYDNPVPGVAVTSAPIATEIDLAVQPVITDTGIDGTTTVWYTSTTAGLHHADVSVGGVAPANVKGSSPVALQFGLGVGDPDHSSWTIDPAGPLTVGQGPSAAYTMTATVHDALDKPVEKAIVAFSVDQAGTSWNGDKQDSCTTVADGTCSVTVTSTTAGDYAFDASLASGRIGQVEHRTWVADTFCGVDNNCVVQPGVTTASRVTVTTPDGVIGDGTAHNLARVEAYDQWGNPIKGATVTSVATDPASGLVIQPTIAPTNADGWTTIWYASEQVGTLQASVSVTDPDGATTGTPDGSPISLWFRPGAADAAKSTLAVDPTTQSVGKSVTATADVTDDRGHGVPGENVWFFTTGASTITDPSGACVAETDGSTRCVTDADGRAQVSVTDTVAQTVMVSAKVETISPVTHAPVKTAIGAVNVDFTRGCVPGVDAGCDYLPGVDDNHRNQVQVTTDGRAAGSGVDIATVKLFDQYGNPASGLTPTTVPTSANLTVSGEIAATDANGASTIGYTSSVAGAFKASVSVGGAEIVFTPQPAGPLDGNAQAIALRSSPVTLNFTDETAPDAPVITVPMNNALTNADPVVVSGTGEVAANVTVSSDGVPTCTTTVLADGTWTCSGSLTNGKHVLVANQKDQAGNPSVDSNVVAVTVDLIAPTAPIVTSPKDGAFINDTTPTITGRGGVAGDTVTVADEDGNVICSTSDVAANGTWSCQVSDTAALPEATITLNVTSTDPAGNPSDPTTVGLTVDATAPDAPVIAVANGSEIGGTAEKNATVTVTVPGVATPITVTADADGRWSVRTPQGAQDGTVTVKATDQAGNVSPEATRVMVVNATDPVIDGANGTTIAGTAVKGSTVTVKVPLGDGATASLTATADEAGHWSVATPAGAVDGSTVIASSVDPAGNTSGEVTKILDAATPDPTITTANKATIAGTAEPGASVAITIPLSDGTSASVVAKADPQGRWTLATPGDALDGSTVTAKATDLAGNVSGEATATLDALAPNAPHVVSPTPGQSINDMTPQISGAGDEPGATITVKDGDATTLCTTTVGEDGAWACTVPDNKRLVDGDHVIVATQTDPAGNGSAETRVPVTVDTIPPAPVTVISPTPGEQTNDTTPLVRGEGGVPGDTIVVTDENGDELCASTVAGDGSYTCQIPGDKALGDGDHTISVVAKDPAGNPSVPVEVPVVVDTVAPDPVHVISPTPGTQTNDTTPTVSGDGGEPGAQIVVRGDDGSQLCSAEVTADGTWSCTVPSTKALPDGDHAITVTQTDPAGNPSDSVKIPVVVDTVAPRVPTLTSPTPGAQTADSTPTVSGVGGEEGTTIIVTGDDGTELCSTLVGADGSWTCAVADDKGLGEGPHTITAKATDPAGNSSGPATVPVVIDQTAPGSPEITVANGHEVTGQAEPGSTVTVTIPGVTAPVEVVTDATGRWSVTTPNGATDGTITATAKDPAGNTSDPTTKQLTVVSDAPVIQVANGHEVAGTAEPGSTVTVTVPLNDGTTATVTGAAGDDGKWTAQTPVGAKDGSVVTATAKDPAGNTSGEVQKVIDTTATDPVISVANSHTVAGTGEPGSSVTVTVPLNDGSTATSTVSVGPDGSWSVSTPSDAKDGSTVTATATDPAGNVSGEVSRTLDVTAPDVPRVIAPQNGSATNDTTPQVRGDGGEPGATVTVTDEGGNELCSSKVAQDGTWSCSVPDDRPLTTDSNHTITVTQTDPAGNSSDSVDVDFTVDTTAPDAPHVTSPTPGEQTNDTTPTVTGEGAEPGSTITVKDETGKDLCATTAGPDGQWSCTVPDDRSLGEGDHTVTVTQTDPAGNGSGETKVPVVVDTTRPEAPTVTSPTPGEQTNDTTPTVTGEGAEPGSTITVKDETGKDLCATTVESDGKWSCTVPGDKGLGEGDHTVTVTQTDPAGNVSDETKVPVVVDTTAPGEVTIESPKPGTQTNDTTPTVSGKGAEPGATISVKDDDGSEVCATTADKSGAWTCTVGDDKALDEGDHTITVTQTDPAGNTSDGVTTQVVVDETAPADPVIEVANGHEVTGRGEPGSTVTVTIPGVKDPITVVTDDTGRWSVTTPEGATDGTVTAKATDPAGNTSNEVTRSFTVDADAPVISVANGSQIGGTTEPGSTVTVQVPMTDGTTVTVTGTADGQGAWTVATPQGARDGAIVTATATDPAGNVSPTTEKVIDTATTDPVIEVANKTTIAGTAEPGSTVTVKAPQADNTVNAQQVTAGPDGTWSVTTPAGTQDGSTIVVQATDPAGNVSREVSRVIDTTSPQPPTVTKPAPGEQTNDTTPEVAGEGGEPGDTIVVRDEDNNELCTSTVRPDGTWSCTVPDDKALDEGDHTITVVEQDPAGNVSDETKNPVVVDTTPPTAPVVTSPAPGEQTNDTTPTVSGSGGEPGGSVVVKDENNNELCTSTVGPDGTWSCTVPDGKDLGEGDHTISVVNQDPAGNTSDPVEVPVVVDVTAPDAPRVIAPTPGEKTADRTPTVSGDGGEPGDTIVVVDEDGKQLCASTVADDGTWTCTVPDPGLSEGDHTITVNEQDPAGNSSGPVRVPVVIDRTAPDAPVIQVANGLQITGTAEAGSTVTITVPNVAAPIQVVADALGRWTIPTPSDAIDGTVTAIATDQAGNVSPQATRQLSLVADAPVISVANGHQIGGTAEPGSTVTVTVPLADGTTATVTGTADGNGAWTAVTPGNARDGAIIVAVATDPDGNVSAPVERVIDTVTTDPVIEVANGSQIGGTAEPGSTVTVKVPQGDYSVDTQEVVAGPDGRWTVPTPAGTKDGATIVVRAVDPAGNPTGEVTRVIDITAPNPPRVDGADSMDVHGTAGSTEPGARLTLTWPDGTTGEATADETGAWTITTPAGMGAGQISVTATDQAGNVSAPTLADLAGPVAPPQPMSGIDLKLTTDRAQVWQAGEVVPYTFTVTNTGFVPLSGVTMDEQMHHMTMDQTCASSIPDLEPGASSSCAATYTVPQSDIDRGVVAHQATAKGMAAGATTRAADPAAVGGEVTAVASISTPVARAASITLVKSTPATSLGKAGDVLTYSFVVLNTGNKTLNNVTVVDPLPGMVTEQACANLGTMAPGAKAECAGTYQVKDTDITAGALVNVASVTGQPPVTPDDPSPMVVNSNSRVVLFAVPGGSGQPTPTENPTGSTSGTPTDAPTTPAPTVTVTVTATPSGDSTGGSSDQPTDGPTGGATTDPTGGATTDPTGNPTDTPTGNPTDTPTGAQTVDPQPTATVTVTVTPSADPTDGGTTTPTGGPTDGVTTGNPTDGPSGTPTGDVTGLPTGDPTAVPTGDPTGNPTSDPSQSGGVSGPGATGLPTGDPTATGGNGSNPGNNRPVVKTGGAAVSPIGPSLAWAVVLLVGAGLTGAAARAVRRRRH